jgi:SAM-dependent methyltransferase
VTRRGRAPDRSFTDASRGARTYPGDPAENYWFRRHEAAYRLAARALRERVAVRVLDAGAGEGYGAAILDKLATTHAVELDGGAARHAAHTYPRLRVVRADACALPFRPETFDAVTAMQVMEHLFCADAFLRQVKSLLRPGGALLLSTPNRDTFSPDSPPNAFHVYEYTAEELEALLRVHFQRVAVAGLREGGVLRRLQRVVGGSLQHLLMAAPFEELPRRVRTVARATRAGWFHSGPAVGSLDLLAIAEP